MTQGFSEIVKVGLTNGVNLETASCPFGWSDDRSQNQLLLQSSGIYFTAALGAPPWSLYRSPL